MGDKPNIFDKKLEKTEVSNQITKKLINLAYQIKVKELDEVTSRITKNLIRDGIGVLLAGIDHPTVKIITSYLEGSQTENGVKVIGNTLKCNLPDTAFIYGCAIHSMDYEPMFLPPTHAVSPVLAPLLAIAQKKDLEGNTFLKAFIAGVQFEAGLRIATKTSDSEAADNKSHFPFEKKGFHPPGTVGTLGSALASSIALGLTEEQCAMAIGYAASRSSGISGNIGTMTKATHCGNAARSGLEAALLTAHGLTSSKCIIETGSGWAEVFGGSSFNYHSLLSGMEELTCFQNPGFAFKKWPSHTAMQIAISAALKLNKGNHSNGEIKVTVPVFNYCNRPNPVDSNDARFSFQYNIAIALVDGNLNLESFTEEKLHSPIIRDYLSRIKLNLCPEIPRDFGQMHIIIETESGEKVISDNWPGHWKTPMTDKEMSLKFESCCSRFWSKDETLIHENFILNITETDYLSSIIKELTKLS